MIKDWQNASCPTHNVINGLDHCNCQQPFFLLSFPTKDVQLRDEWTRRINRKDWQPNYNTRICSSHFHEFDIVKKKPSPAHPYPTLNMGYNISGDKAKQKRKAPPSRKFVPPLKRKYTKKVLKVPCTEYPDVEASSSPISCDNCDKYEQQIKELQKEVKYWQTLYLRKQHKTLSLQTLNDGSKVKMYTGLPSKEVYHGLFSSFGNNVKKIQRWKGPSMKRYQKNVPFKRKVHMPILTAKEEYFIALFCMKTMLKADIIGDLFGISSTTVS